LANATNGSRKISQISSETAAPDGMIFDENGTLYFADLENNKICMPQRWQYSHLVEGEKIRWAEFIYNNYLYFTNSRINEVTADISDMTFTLNKIKLTNN
jgi:hypothetical protein